MIIILFVAYGIEPALWLFTLSSIFQKKATITKINFFMSWLGSYIIICIKQALSISNILPIADIIMFLLLILYYITQYIRLYKCENKLILIICVAVMYIAALLSECIVAILIPFIFGWSMKEISAVGYKSIIATYISKVLLIGLCYMFFQTKFRKCIFTFIKAPAIILVLVSFIGFEIPTIVIYNNLKVINYKQNMLIYFVVSQVFVLLLAICSIVVTEKYRKKDHIFNERINQSYVKLKAYEEANELEIKRYRHDLRNHIKILQELHMEKRYNDADKYLEALQDTLVLEKYFTLKNKVVEALLNQKREEIIEKKILFIPQIGVESYVMSDVEICSVLSNILDNAIEATVLLPEGQREIELIIMAERERTGYLIDVINTSLEPIIKRTEFVSQKEQKGHGIGIKIVKKTIEQYNGKVRFEYDEGKFHVKIFVPYSGRSYSGRSD